MEPSNEKDPAGHLHLTPQPRSVLFAQTPDPGMIIGVVCDAEPSSLALLAAGVSGMAARQARRNLANKPLP